MLGIWLRTAAVLATSLALQVSGALAQAESTVQQLLLELQYQPSSDQAEIQLLNLARGDARARQYLVTHLPRLIEADPRRTQKYLEAHPGQTLLSPTWCNEVQLAEQLKMVEAAQALGKWIALSTSPELDLGSHGAALEDSPAGRALVQIGDPSIRVLKSLLSDADKSRRSHAAYALIAIDSPKSRAVLSSYVSTGRDRELAEYIRQTLGFEKLYEAK